MRLYLVRHGKAELGPEEADRKLSERGVADVQAMAQHLAAQEIRVARVVHSGLVRARETAEILAAHLAPDQPLEQVVGLAPWGDVEKFAQTVEKWNVDTLVCGHEPFIGLAASILMCGDADADLVAVKTGTIMALERSPFRPGWQLRWMLTPRLVRGPKVGGQS
jgi:phosphohistidine phosphatase